MKGKHTYSPTNRKSTEQEKVTDYMAATEHNRNIVNIQAPIEKLSERFGLGVYMYFDFIKFLSYSNFFIFLLGNRGRMFVF